MRFFKAVAVSVLLYGSTKWTFNKIHGEKARWELHKDTMCCFEQNLEAMTHRTAAVKPLTSHLTNHPSKTNKTYRVQLVKYR